MFNNSDTDALRTDLYAVLKKYGADMENGNAKCMLIIAEMSSSGANTNVIVSDACGTCAGIMIDQACTAVMDGIVRGDFYVHDLPAMYKNQETVN